MRRKIAEESKQQILEGEYTSKAYELMRNQISGEVESSFFYMGFYAMLYQHGLNNLANWFYEHSKEELEHSKKVIDFLVQKDYSFVNNIPWNNIVSTVPMQHLTPLEAIKSIFQQAAEKEYDTSVRWREISAEFNKGNFPPNIVGDFVTEQIEEEDKFNHMFKRISSFEKMSDLYIYDRTFKKGCE